MITWFDALLVTLWAVVTALGARRGLAGLLWGLGGVAACLVANLLGRGAPAAALLAVPLGAVVALVARRVLQGIPERPWHLGVGAVGGFALGGVLACALALSFPIEVRVGPLGRTGAYPSTVLPPALYGAVKDSWVKERLMGVWGAGGGLKTLLVPDQARAAR